jgi:hypothetical protein
VILSKLVDCVKIEERGDDDIEVSPCKRIAISVGVGKDAFQLKELATRFQLKRSDSVYLDPGVSESGDATIEGSTCTSTGTGMEFNFSLEEGLKVARLLGVLEEVLPVLRRFAAPLEKVENGEDDKENNYRTCACGCGEGISQEDFQEAGCGYCGDRDCDNECQEVYCSNCGRKDCGAVMDGGFPGDESCILSC